MENNDWFEVDKLSGSVDGEIIITATSSNNSKTNRQVILTFKSTEMSDVVISIAQNCILLDATTPTPQQMGMNTCCKGSFSVTSNIQRTITNTPSLRTLSSTSGSSNTNITITTSGQTQPEHPDWLRSPYRELTPKAKPLR